MLTWLAKLWFNLLKSIESVASKRNQKLEPERISISATNQKLSRVPFAVQLTPEYKSRGLYPKLYPMGAVVHFTAGRSKAGDEDAKNTVSWLRNEGLAAFVISSTGNIFQALDLTKWGYHAGASEYPTLGTGVSSKLVGIEICCAGNVEDLGGSYKSWFGEKYVEGEVRKSHDNANIHAGAYHKYTQAQENALIQLLLWLKSNNPSVFDFDFVLGHDECCAPRGRKVDPGASLSMTMPEFRELLKGKYAASTNSKA